LILGAALLVIALGGHWSRILPPGVVSALAFAAIAAGGWLLLPKAFRAVLRLRPDINLLVVIAAIGASIIGEQVEAAAVVILFGVAEWLEGWADRRARRAVGALLDIAPKNALVKRDGHFIGTVPVPASLRRELSVGMEWTARFGKPLTRRHFGPGRGGHAPSRGKSPVRQPNEQQP
jgi:Cd2+/Zn2+-exporting ATPase